MSRTVGRSDRRTGKPLLFAAMLATCAFVYPSDRPTVRPSTQGPGPKPAPLSDSLRPFVGEYGSDGDRGPATQTGIHQPVALSAEPDGGFLVAEDGHGFGSHVRRVSPDGVVTAAAPWAAVTVLSTGDGGFLAGRWQPKLHGYNDPVAYNLVHVDATGTATEVAGAPHAGRIPGFASVSNGGDP